MSFDNDMNILIQRYLKEEESKDLTLDEIQSCPRWERVILWWIALEKHEGRPLPKMTVEEIKSIYGD